MPHPNAAPITLIIATRNPHKAEEIQAILSDNFRYQTLNDLQGAPTVIEDAASFAGNATKKAAQLAEWRARVRSGSGAPVEKLFVLGDDSGLEVDALQGAPGVLSARFAALDSTTNGLSANENSPDAANTAKLLRLLENVPLESRTARFRCVLALTPVVWAESENRSPACYANEAELATQLFEGVCEGRISFSPAGQKGFGYDPVFIPMGFEQSFAELGEPAKNQISHRAKALARLRERLIGR